MSAVEFFPPFNASLNALSGLLLFVAWRHIRAQPRERAAPFVTIRQSDAVAWWWRVALRTA
jgi:uncharacterized membrane protein YozB (DUF420 family)